MVTLGLDETQARTIRIAIRAQLRQHGIRMENNTPHAIDSLKDIDKWYCEHSHVDSLVRLYTRVNRILTGHAQYNAVIPYTRKPTS